MSDDPKADETPANPPETPAPASARPQDAAPPPDTEAPASPSVASAKEGAPAPTPSRPPIDYAMPAQKSFIPSPALIKNVGCLMKMIFGFTIMLGMAYFALVAMNPKARKWATQGAKDGSSGPTPFKAVNQILAIPAQAMGKTDDVVKANNARVGQLDGLVAEEEAKAKGGGSARTSRPVVDPFSSPSPAGGTSRPDKSTAESSDSSPQAVSSAAMLALAEKRAAASASSEPSAPSSPPPAARPTPQASVPDAPNDMTLPGGIIIAQASPDGAPRAGAGFFFWVVKLNVSGITQSKPARLLLNNRLTYEGDEVHRPLGIVFVRLDPENKLLIFRDNSGATVTRSY